MLTAHRTGGSLIFHDQAGKTIGTIMIPDLGALVAAGDRVPVVSDGGQAGFAWRTQKTCVVSLTGGPVFSCPWHEFRTCSLCVGASVQFSGIDQEVNPSVSTVITPIQDSLPIQTKTPETRKTPIQVTPPGPVKEHVVIPPKKWKPKNPGCTTHARRKAGVTA